MLRQLVLLEAEYETDEVILQVCANKARLFPKFGYSNITDEMLKADISITVNVGMGSGSPQEKMQRFLGAAQAAIKLRSIAPQDANVAEMTKEIYANAGYRDGDRFFDTKTDPRIMLAQRTVS